MKTLLLLSTFIPPEDVPPLPPPDNFILFSYGLDITFTVHPPPQVVDSISPKGLIYLLISLFFTGLFFSAKIKQRSKA
ncbi:MAG: hypothetical protein L3J52_01180 [Proteobacteria bacterium]|nr:hypothetical protein [Pseudomonadota bacterium]